MYHFSAKDISVKQQYKLVIGGVVPRPIAWVSTLNKDKTVYNVAPYSYFSGASNVLPLLTIAVLRVDGKMKDTARNILDTKEAVIQLVDMNNAEEMNVTCTSVDENTSELELIDVELEESVSVDVKRIKNSKIQYETKLYQYVPITDDQEQIITDFFFLEITDTHVDEAVYDLEKEYIITSKLNPVARLAGDQYAVLGEEFSLKRPK